MKTPRLWKREDGSALVEFALILPILVLLLVGMMEFGLILYNQHVITNASREGARFGIVAATDRKDATEITDVVEHYCLNNLITFGTALPVTEVKVFDSDGAEITTDAASFSDDLRVTVTFEYKFLVLPNFIGSLAGIMNLRAETTMKYE